MLLYVVPNHPTIEFPTPRFLLSPYMLFLVYPSSSAFEMKTKKGKIILHFPFLWTELCLSFDGAMLYGRKIFSSFFIFWFNFFRFLLCFLLYEFVFFSTFSSTYFYRKIFFLKYFIVVVMFFLAFFYFIFLFCSVLFCCGLSTYCCYYLRCVACFHYGVVI